MSDERPIAVFDSGVGGLTVVAEIRRRLPGESLVYLGDTAHVPYGSRDLETIVRFAGACIDHLLGFDPKAVVVACNTVSAVALEALAPRVPVPLVDVVLPGAKAAVAFSRRGRVGVLATEATARSGAYGRTIRGLRPGAEVFEAAAPLLVPIIEEGWRLDSPVVKGALEAYLAPLVARDVDALVLGCTHYPLLKPAFHAAVPDGVFLVDSAEETAGALAALLRREGCIRAVTARPEHRFFVTADPLRFRTLGARFLMDRNLAVEEVNL